MDIPLLIVGGAAALAVPAAILAIGHATRLGREVDEVVYGLEGARLQGGWRNRGSRLTAAVDRIQSVGEECDRQRARLAEALRAAPIGVFITDDQGIVVFSNRSAESYIGARHGEAVAELRIRQTVEEATAQRERAAVEVELYTPRRRVLSIEAMPLEQGAECIGTVAFVSDATEQRRVDEMRRDFIANVSHELKTPVGAVAALAETLEGRLNRPEVAERLVGRLRAESLRLSRLIDDILDLSRAEAAEHRREAVDIDDLVAEVLVRSRSQADEAGAVVTGAVQARGAVVVGDALQLRIMLTNLVDNAIKYRDPAAARSAQILVRTSRHGDRVLIEVVDDGIGIAESHLDRIFERFYRVDRARSRETGGTGLGLSIARHIALAHGGEITVESRLGVGSTFRVSLPAGGSP